MSRNLSRRHFINTLTRSAAAAHILGAAGTTALTQSFAAEAGDYKALVCVFLLGGMDTHDVLIPHDQQGYDNWANIRAPLLTHQAQARARPNLLAISAGSTATLEGSLALPPELSGLHQLYTSGRLALAANVGPLVQPTNRQAYEQDAVQLPPKLFSHNDQQSVWQASAPEGAQFGWGGLFADAMMGAGANGAPEFSTITTLGNQLFLTGQTARPYQVGIEGASNIELAEDPDLPLEMATLLKRHFEGTNADRSNVLTRDLADAFDKSLNSNRRYNQASASVPALSTQFPTSFLGGQLRAVARTIAARGQLQANRQIFFVGVGGFDTHSQQAQDLPRLLQDLDTSLTSFYQSLQELNLGSKVTLFTASDFGRTLAINGDGTDHGWGSHHFVLGDAVRGGQVYGNVPPPSLGHDFDAGGGRLIPTWSVEQYATPFGRWFGLNDSELNTALPNRANFLDQLQIML